MEMLVTALVSSAIAILGAATGLIVSYLNGKKQKKELDDIRKEIDEGGAYYVTCPNCGTRILLTGSAITREDSSK